MVSNAERTHRLCRSERQPFAEAGLREWTTVRLQRARVSSSEDQSE